MLPVRIIVPLQFPVYRSLRIVPKSNPSIKFHVEINSYQKRKFSRSSLYLIPKGNTVHKIRKLSLYIISGGIFLGALFLATNKTQLFNLSNINVFSSAKVADEIALKRYFELLERYPKLKREGDLNDYTKGTYEIIYNLEDILAVRNEIYKRLYDKSRLQGLAHAQADELATNFSRPGVVCEDQFWLWIRDVVISPQGYRHTYNRIVWKCDLERTGGAAALPIVLENGIKKIVLLLAFRHATNSWELEIPRGGSKVNETPIDTARREILEEAGYPIETSNMVSLGSLTPDSGLTASVVPVFLGKVTVEKLARQDKTEAIKGKYVFTVPEIMEGLKRGYMEIKINESITRVPIRDPGLAYAILMAQYEGHL